MFNLNWPELSEPIFEVPPLFRTTKNNKHKHFGRDGVGDKWDPFLGQMGPLPGTKWDPSLGQAGLSLFNSTVKSQCCPVCPWDGWGFVPGTIVPQGPLEKCLCVFCLLVFFAPKSLQTKKTLPGFRIPIRHPIPMSDDFPFSLEFPNAVVLNAVVRRNTQMCAKERK